MVAKRYAAIDIGSNAVRLLIKEVCPRADLMGCRLDKILLLRVPLRLGFDVFAQGYVSAVKGDRLRRLMKSFRQLMKIYEVARYRACATAAMRGAANGEQIIRKVKKDTGIDIEIISGYEEATLIYNNHLATAASHAGQLIYVDVGGGSTEVSVLDNGALVRASSYDIGTVRLLSNAVAEGAWQQLRADLSPIAAAHAKVNIVGSGGNINKLYRLAAKKDKSRQRLPISSLQALYEALVPLTVAQRQERYRLRADRADVIVPAAQIFLTIATIVGADYVCVPVVGLADGIIDSLYAVDREG